VKRYGAISMTPQKHKAETLRSLVDVTEAAARKQPSVMLFEDVHPVDQQVERFMYRWEEPATLRDSGLREPQSGLAGAVDTALFLAGATDVRSYCNVLGQNHGLLMGTCGWVP
jgi:hypothetical protein